MTRSRARWRRDPWLVATMLLASVLVLAAYVVPAVLLFGVHWFVGAFFATLAGCLLFAYALAGPTLTLRGVGATVVEAGDQPELHALERRLARQADASAPTLAVLDSREANAFTVGFGRGAVVCVTTGLLATLDRDELAAVLAHELAHVKNHDSLAMTLAAFPFLLGHSVYHAGSDVAKSGIRGVVFGVVVAVFGALLALLTAPGVLVLSRMREYAADRGAVAITGDASTLASALRTLDGDDGDGKPETDARRLGTLSAFCVVPPVDASLPWMHPATDERIARLRRLERRFESSRG